MTTATAVGARDLSFETTGVSVRAFRRPGSRSARAFHPAIRGRSDHRKIRA